MKLSIREFTTINRKMYAIIGLCMILMPVMLIVTPVTAEDDLEVRYIIDFKDYNTLNEFHDGLAWFQKQDDLGVYDGFIDLTGKEVIKYPFTQDFSEGLAAFVIINGGPKGYIDRVGNIVIEPQYGWAGKFCEGLAAVQKEDKWGYMDKTGKEIIKPIYDYAGDFHDGMAIVGIRFNDHLHEYKYGIVNNKGEEVVKPQYEYAKDYCGNMAAVGKDGKFGYVDKTGREVIKLRYDSADSFNDGNAIIFEKNDGFGFIDTQGNPITKPMYSFARPYRDGLAAVVKNGKWGFIDKTGKEIIEPRYNFAEDFHEGLARIEKDGKQGFINVKGEEVIKAQYTRAGNFSEGVAGIEKDGKWGYIDKTGVEIIGFIFDYADNFKQGLARVMKGGKTAFIASPLDVPDAWSKDEVHAAINANLVPSYMQYRYKENINRRDFTALVVSIIKSKTGKDMDTFLSERNLDTKNNPFVDVNGSEADVIAANKLGIVNGIGNEKFNPDGEITRQEAAIMLARTAKVLGIDTLVANAPDFSDKNKVLDWAKQGVEFVSSRSIMTGIGNKSFDPTGKYTRQQAFITVLRLLKYAKQ